MANPDSRCLPLVEVELDQIQALFSPVLKGAAIVGVERVEGGLTNTLYLIRPEIFNSALKNSQLPKQIGAIVDIVPINQEERSVWLMLAESGAIIRWDADAGNWVHLGSVDVSAEPDHEPWAGHVLRRRLHASGDGNFVAVVNDYGRYGQILDLRSGEVTLALDGGQYHFQYGSVFVRFC